MIRGYLIVCVFFFKQKTAYEMRISDWSSDVCSSDLADPRKTQMLIAALAGLSRIDAQDGASLAQDHGFNLGAASRWSRAIDAAAGRGEKGSVALLAAVGMQTAEIGRAHV